MNELRNKNDTESRIRYHKLSARLNELQSYGGRQEDSGDDGTSSLIGLAAGIGIGMMMDTSPSIDTPIDTTPDVSGFESGGGDFGGGGGGSVW
jgi:uncharacterized membrane protein YgcG